MFSLIISLLFAFGVQFNGINNQSQEIVFKNDVKNFKASRYQTNNFSVNPNESSGGSYQNGGGATGGGSTGGGNP